MVMVAQAKGPDLMLKIRDNGDGMSKLALYNLFENQPVYAKGVALKNIRMRMQLYYSRDITIQSERVKGTEVTFLLPLNREIQNKFKGGFVC